MLSHKKKTNTWLNIHKSSQKQKAFKINETFNLPLIENNTRQEEPSDVFLEENKFMISYLDLDKNEDNDIIEHMYQIQNIMFFIMFDFIYYDTPMLSLNGIIINPVTSSGDDHDNNLVNEEIKRYLEQILNLDYKRNM